MHCKFFKLSEMVEVSRGAVFSDLQSSGLVAKSAFFRTRQSSVFTKTNLQTPQLPLTKIPAPSYLKTGLYLLLRELSALDLYTQILSLLQTVLYFIYRFCYILTKFSSQHHNFLLLSTPKQQRSSSKMIFNTTSDRIRWSSDRTFGSTMSQP